MKADWDLGVPVRADIAIFHDKYDNEQLEQTLLIDGTATALVENGGSAINQGAELETSIQPFKTLTLSAFASFLSAMPKVTIPDVVQKNWQAGDSPRWKAGLNGRYTLPLPSEIGQFVLTGDISWQSSVHLNPFEFTTLPNSSPSFAVANARLEWDDIYNQKVDLAFWSTNIANRTYIAGGYPIQSLGFESSVYGEPRMFGVTIRKRF
jgi:iron complex outermembrane recepter protein